MFSSLNIFSCLGLSLVFSTLVHSEPNVITKRTPLDIQPVSEQVTIDPLGAYVRACHLDDGSIIAGYSTTIDNGAQKVQPIAKSTDGGLTWNQIGQVVQNQTSTSDVANAFPLQLPSGRILFAYRNHDLNPDRSYATYRITLSYSDDGGSTWAYLSDVDVRQATAIKNGLWEPFIRVAANGEVQVYYSAESADLVQTVLMRSSADSGLTWSDSIVASVGATNDTRDGMPGVANLDDNGNLM
jgi:Neuraminidase (sialidase)